MAGPAYYSGEMFIAKNEDWIVAFIYGSGDPEAVPSTFVPIDLTDSTLKWAIRKNEADHEATVWVASPDDGITITDAIAGEFTVKISRDKLERIAPGDYVSDLVRLMPTGDQERIWEGTATIVHGTTP